MILFAADIRVIVHNDGHHRDRIVYFYITLRGSDVEARHKVPWFFEAALAAAILTMFAGAIDLALATRYPQARAVISKFSVLRAAPPW